MRNTPGHLSNYTGLTVPWVRNLMLVIFVGASGAGNATFVCPSYGSNIVIALSNWTTYLFGPLNSGALVNSSGLVQVNMSVFTGNSVAAYIPPGGNALHMPMEQAAGVADY